MPRPFLAALALLAAAPAAADVATCHRLASSESGSPYGGGRSWDALAADAERTIAVCREAVAAEPRDARLVFLLGRALDASGDLETALPVYQRAAELGSVSAMRDLGVSLAHDGRNAEARPWLERAAAAGDEGAAEALADLP